MRKINIYLFLVLFFSIFAYGCDTVQKVPPIVQTSVQNTQEETDVLNADIFIDGTPSMLGYTRSGSNTSYEQVIPLLELAAARSWPNGQTAFYKFGDSIVKLKDREFLKAATPEFYEYGSGFRNTCIDKVIETAKPQNLTVIVTDLFANESDTNLLNKKLKEKYLNTNLSVGVVGIKSQFDGVVYDIGIDKSTIKYSSGENDITRFRPFYLLVLGKHLDVVKYFENLKESGVGKLPGVNFSLTAGYIVNPLPDFSSITSITKNGLAEVNNLVEDNGTDKLQQFRVKKKEKEAGFTAKLKFSQIPYIRKFDPSKIESEIKAVVFNKGEPGEAKNVSKAVKVSNVLLKDNELQFDVSISVNDLPLNKVCNFELTLAPDSKCFEQPNWIREWDLNQGKLREWIEKPASFEGGTTINLERFMNGLWQSNIQINQPKIARCNFYIIKK